MLDYLRKNTFKPKKSNNYIQLKGARVKDPATNLVAFSSTKGQVNLSEWFHIKMRINSF